MDKYHASYTILHSVALTNKNKIERDNMQNMLYFSK